MECSIFSKNPRRGNGYDATQRNATQRNATLFLCLAVACAHISGCVEEHDDFAETEQPLIIHGFSVWTQGDFEPLEIATHGQPTYELCGQPFPLDQRLGNPNPGLNGTTTSTIGCPEGEWMDGFRRMTPAVSDAIGAANFAISCKAMPTKRGR